MEGKDSSYVYMYACSHDLLTFNLFTQDYKGKHHERIATLERHIKVLQIDEDDDNEDGGEESARDGDDPKHTEPDV